MTTADTGTGTDANFDAGIGTDADAGEAEAARAAGSALGLIAWHAERRPHAPALLIPDGPELTYRALAALVAAAEQGLRDLGLGPGHRVASVLADGLEAAVFFLAATGATVCCPLNPAYSAGEYDKAFADLAPAALVVAPGLSATARTAAERAGLPVVEFDVSAAAKSVAAHSADLHPADLHPTELRAADPADLAADLATGLFTLLPGSPGTPAPADGPQHPDTGERLLLQTSGTTERSKIVPLSWATMAAGARASCRAYSLGPDDRRLNIMALFHVQGLVGSVLTSLACGSSVVCAGAARPQDVLDWVARYEATWFSASPTMHRRILDSAPADWAAPERLRFVRSGSAALPPALRAELEAYYRLPVIESYGMTEAHQIASTPVELGARAMVPTGSELAFLVDGEVLQKAGVRGEIVVRGANVIARYLAPQEANASSFVDGWFRTGDEGELGDDGTLRITGRIKDLIVRGGEKVFPGEVENALLAHPAVHQAVVFGTPDPELTEQVVALVVLRPGASATDLELREAARTRLAPYKVPGVIERRDELPLSTGGKISRSAIAAAWRADVADAVAVPTAPAPVAPAPAAAASAEPAPVAPSTPLEAALAGIWSLVLKAPVPGVHDDFFALGGQSVEGVSLLAMIRESLNVEIDLLTLFDEANTISRMAAVIEAERHRVAS